MQLSSCLLLRSIKPFQRKTLEISLHPVLSYLQNGFALWKFSELLPFFLLVKATNMSMEHWRNYNDREKQKYLE
jgi:hypothetical protein